MNGRVVHFELPFDDGERARTFYREVFGWNVQELPEMDYTMVSSGPVTDQGMPSEPGYINGGMVRRGVGAVTGPVITVAVDSVDEALRTIEKLGGTTIAGRQAVGEMGFTGYFEDPEGNLVGLWENAPS